MKLTINIEGVTTTDLLMALDEVERLVLQGFKSGFDRNDSGSYRFDVEGIDPDDVDEKPEDDEP